MKIRTCPGQITLSKIDEICPSAIPNRISTISMHIPSLGKIHWYLLILSSKNENTDLSRADNSVNNWRNMPINNPKPDLHNINAHTKFGENPLTFTQVIVRKRKYGRMMDGHTDSQCDTIIPRHYHVAGYKKGRKCIIRLWKGRGTIGQFNDAVNKTEYNEVPLTRRSAPFMNSIVVPSVFRGSD